jgi:hypothetical protein
MMARPKKDTTAESINDTTTVEVKVDKKSPSPNDIDWTDHVLGLLSDDEKIAGNPTTDGLRRIFEIALDCVVINAESSVAQSPTIDNERRATVVHTITYILNNDNLSDYTKLRTVSGSADVYWGNCDKIYRNHPVAVAETRAEGRALRRALKLRKVVAAEEIAKDVDTEHLEENNLNKINSSQLNFFDVFGKRLNINLVKLLNSLDISSKNVYNISYDDAVKTITTLSGYQHNNNIPDSILGYDPNWK